MWLRIDSCLEHLESTGPICVDLLSVPSAFLFEDEARHQLV